MVKMRLTRASRMNLRTFVCRGVVCGLYFLAASSVAVANDGDWRQDPEMLLCEPRELTLGQELTLRLGKQHPSELAITRDADGKYFFLVSKSDALTSPQLMTAPAFKTTRDVVLPGRLQAITGTYGERPTVVFDRVGTYRVLLSNALESEEGGFFCEVKVVARKQL